MVYVREERGWVREEGKVCGLVCALVAATGGMTMRPWPGLGRQIERSSGCQGRVLVPL